MKTYDAIETMASKQQKLREEYGIHIEPTLLAENDYSCTIARIKDGVVVTSTINHFTDYDKALKAGLYRAKFMIRNKQ